MTISRDRAQPESAGADAPHQARGAGIVPGTSSAAMVMAALGAARRRIRLTLLVRAASVAGPAGIALGAAGALLPLGGPLWLPWLLGSAGLVGAAAWALLQTPTLAGTASALDMNLDLRDRTAAAYQLHDNASPVARLVVHDAATRLTTLSVAATFPFAIPRAALMLAPVAVLLCAALAWPISSQERAGRQSTAGAGAGTQQAAPASSKGTAPARDTAAGDSAAREADVARRASGSPDGAPPSQPPQPSGRAPASADRPGDRPEEAASQGSRIAARGPGVNPAASGDERTAEQQPRAGGPAPQRDATIAAATAAASPDGRGLPNPARSPQGGPVAGGRGGRGASDADAMASARAGTGAGGVSQGALTALPRVASARLVTAQAPAGLSTRYGAARAGAEAALTRDMIPPDLRDYVREYFRAIAPAGQR